MGRTQADHNRYRCRRPFAPVDTPYPGTISLNVDVTNVNDRIMNVHETIPVKGREITLLYPEWLPGTHSPSNPVESWPG